MGGFSGNFFDPTASASASSQDTIGSYVLGAAGSVVTSSTVGSLQALDVNITNTNLMSYLNGIYNATTNPLPTNVGLIASTRTATPGITTQTQEITAGVLGATLTPANSFGLDTAAVLYGYDGTNYARVGMFASQLAVTDSYSSFTVEAHSVTTTATTMVTSVLTNRTGVEIYNNGNQSMAVGDASVTFAGGWIIPPRSGYEFKFRSGVVIFGVTGASTTDARVMQKAA